MLPEVVRACQDAAVLGPDDLLADEGAELLPHAFDHRLPVAGVPAAPGGIGRDGADEVFVEVRVLG
jgi:hypothetical protein